MSALSPAIRDFLALPGDERRLGPYRCREVLDQQGTAPVFRAVEEHAGRALREVAVKVFDIGRAKPGAAEAWQARVVDEARALCRVQHPNVIRFHSLFTEPKRGLMGIIMEFAEGVSLAAQRDEVPAEDARRTGLAVQIGIDIAAALTAAHEAGVVHCNVKPSNIMFTGGTYKLINFGIAAALRPSAEDSDEPRSLGKLTDLSPDSIGTHASVLEQGRVDATRSIAGSVGYVDPTCVRTTAPPTSASDVYSLGITLYEYLTGDVPAVVAARRAGQPGVDAKVLTGEAAPVPLAEVVPSVPAALAKLVDSMLAPGRDTRPRSADAVLRALTRIRSVLAGRERTLPDEERGPFPGLERYEASDRDVFFGRSAEVAGVIELLRTRGLVGVVGAAGTGKSSLVRAGVIPAIEDGALEGWPTRYRSVVVTPGTDPMGALRAALREVLGTAPAEHPEAIAEQLAANVDATEQGIVILIDQLEEIVTQHQPDKEAERLELLDLLLRVAEAPVGVRVLVTARRDLLDEILQVDPHFARALSRGIQLLGPLSRSAWEEVLDQSLEAYGYRFSDDELRREVLADLRGREAAMPLAQFGLSRLWAAREGAEKTIARAAFDAKGGMRSALEHHADATVAGLKLPRETVRDLLLALTTPEGARAHVLRPVLVERFGAEVNGALTALMDARLLIEETAGVALVHDSLLHDWTLLRGWIHAARDDRLLVAQLERDAARWSETKDSAELWRKSRLEAGVDVWRRGLALSPTARDFIRESAREARKVKMVFWTLVTLLVSLVVGGSLFYAQESQARAQQARRDADALAAALAEVRTLKQQAEEAGGEAAASAALLADLQRKMAAERASYGKQVKDTLRRVATATSLGNAQKATEDLSTRGGPSANQVVPLPADMTGGAMPKLNFDGPSPTAGVFDTAAIERVVNMKKAGVKRVCLERSTSTASTSKVTATITIAPNGSVQNVTSAGDEPVVARCIEQQLRNWAFPAPGEVKEVQIPFVFVRQ